MLVGQRNFFTALALEKKALEEARVDSKRKYEADVAKQKTHNNTVKGEGRKRFKQALKELRVKEEATPAIGMKIAIAAATAAFRVAVVPAVVPNEVMEMEMDNA